jgi:fumarate hydratase subunit beta
MKEADRRLHRLRAPFDDEAVGPLRVRDRVLLSGMVYAARDAAHRRMIQALDAGQDLPVPLEGQVIYYVGPAPGRPGEAIGPAGPTTATRVDAFTPRLLEQGLRATIGKGRRSPEVRQAQRDHRAVYLVAVGGAAALLAQRIRSSRVVAYPDLGPEAIRCLELEDFPLVVGNDVYGGDMFESALAAHRRGS